MSIELKVPAVGESITEVEIGNWLKREGDFVQKDENIVVLESEKATVEIPAPSSGTLGKILKQKGESAQVGEVIAQLEEGNGAPAASGKREKTVAAAQSGESKGVPEPVFKTASQKADETKIMPAAQRVMAERGLKPEQVTATGPGGRILKEDVLRLSEGQTQIFEAPATAAPKTEAAPLSQNVNASFRQEETIRMTKLRRTIATRLVEAQHNAALLTTFNEIDMTNVMAMRKEFGEAFLKRYNVKLGFMSFFAKAVIDALKQTPELNAEIRGEEIVYKNYFDIGVVGTERGLVVPVIRNAEHMSFAEIEKAIGDFGTRAKENKLKIEELQGGTFTITNGGIYGSLLSTPIINPPQSGVLGMHSIQERPIALNGQVVIRPMMYVALTYDHRIVDGKEAVTFLKRVKEAIESPARMLIEI